MLHKHQCETGCFKQLRKCKLPGGAALEDAKEGFADLWDDGLQEHGLHPLTNLPQGPNSRPVHMGARGVFQACDNVFKEVGQQGHYLVFAMLGSAAQQPEARLLRAGAASPQRQGQGT